MIRKLEDILEPGEEIRARSGLGHAEVWAVLVPILLVVYGLDAIQKLPPWISARSALPETLAWPATVLAVGLVVLLAIRFTGFLSMIAGGDRLLVTDSRVLWWFGPLGLARRSLDRSQVGAATAYKGDRLLILHLADGRDLRLRQVEDVEAALRALDVPGRIWRPGSASDITTRLESFNKLAFLATVAVMLAIYFLVDGAAGLWNLSGEARLLWWFVAIPAAGLVTSFLLFDVVRHFLAARRLDHRAMRYFACSRLDRAYQGREPWPETGGPPWIWWPRAYRRWIARHAYKGQLDCACEPQVIGSDGDDEEDEP